MIDISINEVSELRDYENEKGNDLTKEELITGFEKLKNLLENYDSKAIDEIGKLYLSTEFEFIRNDFRELKKTIEAYDFENGKDLVEEIVKKLFKACF